MDSQRVLLIVGWNAAVLRMSRVLGLRSVSVIAARDESRLDFDWSLCDVTVVVKDHGNLDEVLGALERNRLLDRTYAAVYTDHELSLLVASALGTLLGVRTVPWRVAIAFRDKAVQKTLVRQAGLPTAKFSVLEAGKATTIPAIEYPAVLKPVAGTAAIATRVVRSADEVVAALEDYARRSADSWVNQATYLLEQFVEGSELHINGVVQHGKVKHICIARYRCTSLEAAMGNDVLGSIALDPHLHEALYCKGQSLAGRAMSALGLEDGVFHLEAFENQHGELIFGECACRRGACLVREMCWEKFGIDLSRAAIEAISGLSVTPPPHPPLPAAIGELSLPAPAGRLVRCPGEEELLALPSVLRVALRATTGQVIPGEPGSVVLRLGDVVVTAPSEQELEERMRALLHWFEERTEVVAA